MSPSIALKRKALLICLLPTAAFVLFNLLYWPTRMQQEYSHPASFPARARLLLEENQPEAARETLLEGIAAFNPPSPEPYDLLAQVQERLFDVKGAEDARRRTLFYSALQQAPADAVALISAGEGIDRPYKALVLDAPCAGLVRRAAASFGAAFGIREALTVWSTATQLAILDLAGSSFSFNGQIGAVGVVAPASLLVFSGGGMDERRGAHIFVGGRDYADRQRGMHVVLLDGATGAVLQTGAFDLWESADEARRMRRFLEESPQGCIGLFAVRDDGSAFMTLALEQALFNFGLERRAMAGRTPALLGLRYGFAAIGVKGAARGTAMQSWSPEEFKGYRGHPVVCAVFHGEGRS